MAKYRESTFYQKYEMTNLENFKFFLALVGTVETYGGAYGQELGILQPYLKDTFKSQVWMLQIGQA